MGTKMEENMGQKTNQEQVAIKRTKSNGRKEYDLYADTLCWNCKRCTNPDSHPCPWAEKGEPIEGWTAAPGREFFHYLQTGEKVSLGCSYVVTACPLFVQDRPFSTYAEGIQWVADALEISPSTVLGKPALYFQKYEEVYGKKLPHWLVNYGAERIAFPNNLK